jgi:hypothetical protein
VLPSGISVPCTVSDVSVLYIQCEVTLTLKTEVSFSKTTGCQPTRQQC